jgi:thiol-disulfide isomerase/thioredoxin
MKGKFDSLIHDIRPVVVDFHAQWCSPCKMQSPILKEVANELGDRMMARRFGGSLAWLAKINCIMF